MSTPPGGDQQPEPPTQPMVYWDQHAQGQAYPPPPGQPAYGPPGYGPPGWYGPPPSYRVVDHPRATTALVLGLVALVGGLACYLPLAVGPFAWAIGRRVVRDIDAEPQRYGGRGLAMAGYVLGVFATVLLVIGIFAVLAIIVLAFAPIAGQGGVSDGVRAM